MTSTGGGTSGPGLSATLRLPTTVMRAGSRLAGRITITNDTGKPLHVSGCRGLFQVLLTSRTYHPLPLWLDCLQTFTIPTGRWSQRVQVDAAYNQCDQGRATAGVPKCAPSGTPALPPGQYVARVFEQTTLLPRPASLTVLVTR
ncbi:MAG TPA: hypothetical protein VG650_04270 [Mycobacteriales bacterium]|nr:hypothetical protein [Mycobacteriales bacterium]